MNSSSRIMGDIARCLGTTDSPEPLIHIEPNWIMAGEVPLSWRSGIPGTAPANQSVSVQSGISVNAGSGAIASGILQLAPGLWDLFVQGSLASNYFLLTGVADANIFLQTPTSSLGLCSFIAGGAPASPCVQAVATRHRVLLDQVGTIAVTAPNNGAGQNLNAVFNILCSRLVS